MQSLATRCRDEDDASTLGQQHDGEPVPGMVGQHPRMREVFRLVRRLAGCCSPVLVCGETGTGKELVARALHRLSPWRQGPFEAVNCAAIPENLAESELFGHTRGAFTGATRNYCGAFERADGGTLFLDEIGEMPSALQGKLLRALEDGTLRRLGAEQTLRVRVRIVAATNRDLESEAAIRRFRLDLYHRLAVGIIALPALRDRGEDVPQLTCHFLAELGRRDGKSYRLDEPVIAYLGTRHWDGNVRALRNAVERAVAWGGETLRVSDFVRSASSRAAEPQWGHVRYQGRSFAEIQREIYERTLEAHGGNRTAAAAALSIPKSTFSDHVRTMKIVV